LCLLPELVGDFSFYGGAHDCYASYKLWPKIRLEKFGLGVSEKANCIIPENESLICFRNSYG
jgi:hypothetical protein